MLLAFLCALGGDGGGGWGRERWMPLASPQVKCKTKVLGTFHPLGTPFERRVQDLD